MAGWENGQVMWFVQTDLVLNDLVLQQCLSLIILLKHECDYCVFTV